MTIVKHKPMRLIAACLLGAASIWMTAANTEAASWHPFYNVCQVSPAPIPSGQNFSERYVYCAFLQAPGTPYSQSSYQAQLGIHAGAGAPTRTHDYARLPALSGWDWMYNNNKLGTYCPQVNIKALCSKSQGTWNSPLTYSQGWVYLGGSYRPGDRGGSGSNWTSDLYCPSDRPYMLNGNADTQMWW